jgi:hypothetical protein
MSNKVIGYVPYTFDLSHPGDRRRLAFWAKRRGVGLNLNEPFKSDLIVLSNAANFSKYLKESKVPIVLDLVDSYLSETPSCLKDTIRNTIRAINGTSSLKWIRYTKHLKYACQNADAIVVASAEQLQALRPYNKNVYVISDSHSEVEVSKESNKSLAGGYSELEPLNVMWEGFGSNLRNFKFVSHELDDLIERGVIRLKFVTEINFYRWGGYIWRVSTKKSVKKLFPKTFKSIEIVPWTITNLKSISRQSELAIIPIDEEDSFARMKPENKLLSMWRLGLPAIFSDTPSYRRTAEAAKCETALVQAHEWRIKLINLAENRDQLEELSILGINYVEDTHSDSILSAKWDTAISETLTRFVTKPSNNN